MYIPDNLDLFDRYDRKLQQELKQLPVCDHCGEPICGDFFFEIEGEIICPICMMEYRRSVEDYIG